MSEPVVTVVSPCYQQAAFIGELVESVKGQTLGAWELVVVDDGSTDGSHSVAEQAAGGDPRVRIARFPNGGMTVARNRGAALAAESSRYLLFLDGDDALKPNALERLAGHLDAHPDVGVVACRLELMDESGAPSPTPEQHGVPRYMPTRFGIRQMDDDELSTPLAAILVPAFLQSCSMLRRTVFEAAGRWDEELGDPYDDVHMFLRMRLEADVHAIPDRLIRYRVHGSQASAPARREKFIRQRARLERLWRDPTWLPSEKRREVRAAWRFMDRQYAWAKAREAAAEQWRVGHRRQALGFLGGAARRWASSVLSPSR